LALVPKITARTLEEHRAGTIDRLLDAWSELVMTRGYEGASLADVAAKAGLARTAIYNYFPDKDSLLFAWTDREVHRTLAILEQEIADSPTYAEKLRAFIRLQLVDFASRHLPPGHEVIQFLQPETYHRFMAHIEPVERVLRSIIDEGIQSGEFVDTDPEAMVPMVMACIGSERAPLASRTHAVDDATERVASFVLRALTPAVAKPAPKRASKAATKARAKRR
jgi:AcrR family transcriptional regulator